jgi:hypothetical protein
MTSLRNLYSDRFGRRAAQACVDALVIVWVALWMIAGHLVHTGMETVAQSGYEVRDRAGSAAGRLDTAQSAADNIPLLGDRLGQPFQATGDAVRSLQETGQGFGDWFVHWAWPVGIATALIPILAVVPLWLALRIRFARRAAAARAIASMPGGPRLLALRALATHPVTALAQVGPDPLGAFERGRPEVIDRLARLELAACGVVPGPLLPALER